MIRRALLIANPAARRAARVRDAAVAAFEGVGVRCDVLLTERPGHAAELARERCRDYDAVFALGGDGTVMEIAGALVSTEIPLGVLAGGTGNLLARAVGIPLDVARAVPTLVAGDRRRIDLGRLADGRFFAIAAGVGIDARMVRDTPGWMKRRLGVLAYAITATRAALGAVIRRDFFRVRLTVDGAVYDRRAAAAMVANFGAILHDRITFGPGIQSDDGLLDACIYSPQSLRDALRIMWRLLRRDFRSDDRVLYRSGRHIHLETDPRHEVQADGELVGMTPLDVEVVPLAALFLVPRA
ncbi:MAG: diacylglycerol kinase family lipid kinase [Gemmatimonadota bacterium]|nr:diacylglycerol kinase family lipid kinase [Gemmatimonadota bacterium]